jgi:mRNA-degrading endonuclease toxin of MazEF toxin-antitoxin module
MDRGDIYFVALDPTAGHEQRGHRPVLVLTTANFNKLTGAPVVLPITRGGAFARNIGFAVALSGTKISGLIRCDQPRVLDPTARKAKKVERAPDQIVEEALAKVAALFD